MIHSFLLIGQSNMAGRGKLSEAIPINTERIKILRNGRWQPMFRPINPDRPFSGVSLAESFAEAYANKYGVDVGLICCADGGTNLEQWKEGSLLYDNAVFQAKLAQRTSTIAGVLWLQGASDLKEQAHIDTYAQRLTVMLSALKRDLNLYDVPFLLGGQAEFLKDCPDFPFGKKYEQLNLQTQKVVKQMPMTAYVSVEGLTSNEDFMHYNSKSLYELGLRYFQAYEQTHDPNKVFEEKEEIKLSWIEKL